MNATNENQRDQDPTELPSTDSPPQPNDPKVKQYANKQEAQLKANEKRQQDQGRSNAQNIVDPQHGAKVRDKGSPR